MKYDLSVVLKAVDQATAPVRALTVQIHRLTAPLKNVKLFDQFKELGKAVNFGGIQQALGGVKDAVGGVGSAAFGLITKLTAIGLIGGTAFAGFIRSAEAAGSRLDDNANRAGVAVDWYAQTEYAAKKAGLGNEEFAAGLDSLTKNMGAMHAGKGGKFLAFLNDISPAFAAQMKGAKSTSEAFGLLTKSLSQVTDPARRAILSEKAFGNLKFGAWLGEGADALDRQRRLFEYLAGPQAEFARAAGVLGDAFDDLGTAVSGTAQSIAGTFFPVMKRLSELVTGFIVKNRDTFKQLAKNAAAAIQRWVDSGGFERLVESLSNIATLISRVVNWLGPMGTALAAVGVMALPLVASLGSLGVALVGLAVQLPALILAAPAFAAALSTIAASAATALLAILPFAAAAAGLALAGIAVYENWADIKDLFANLGETLAITWRDGIKPMLEGLSFLRNIVPGGPVAWEAGMALGDRLAGPQQGVGNIAASVASYREATSPIAPVQTEARVTVDFANMPRGTRVSTDPTNSQPVDLSMGWQTWDPS